MGIESEMSPRDREEREMSYCRLGDNCDIYLYEHYKRGWRCCWCVLPDFLNNREDENIEDFEMYTLQAVLDHIEDHRRVGHKVPEYVFTQVQAEIVLLGPESPRGPPEGHELY